MILRCFVSLLVGASLLVPLNAATPKADPLDSLPPTPVPYPVKPDEDKRTDKTERAVDRRGLADELQLLEAVRQRVRRRMLEGRIAGVSPEEVEQEMAREEQAATADQTVDPVVGEPRASHVFDKQLSVTHYQSGAMRVQANIQRERVQVIYTELITLMERSFDDQLVGNVARRVSFHVQGMPWEQALTALLGQAGLAWRLNGEKIVIYELTREQRERGDVHRLAEQSFTSALAGGESVFAAKAAYLLAKQEHKDKQLYPAMSRYEEVIRRFQDKQDNPAIAVWVHKAWQGVGDVLFEMEQYREARNIYLNYISLSELDDPDLPRIRLAAARASHALAKGQEGKRDTVAADRAQDLLQSLIQDYRKDIANHDVVADARIMLGELLFEKGEFAAARSAFGDYADMIGMHKPDLLTWYLAECDYQMGLASVRERLWNKGDNYLLAAREGYAQLAENLRSQQVDKSIDQDIYRRASFRMGLCHLNRSEPDFVKALFDFMRARQFFRDQPLEAQIIVHICRCYDELQQEEQLVKQLWKLLEKADLSQPGQGQLVMEDLVGQILTRLSGYHGNTKHKILFYIAQSRYREALWNTTQRAMLLDKAVHTYQRILSDTQHPAPEDLKMVVKIGLARSALLSGDDDLGISHLQEVIRAKQVHRRDAALALQLLLDHYRSQGRYEEAVRDYEAYMNGGQE